ncbi:hypothetical protein, partial [Pseudoalteromonas peptidolytica]|uniref:hypothetical protein n=1 Tax=Pseudoalteromonas peptidolytica TaxID=61150 RepID=UPI001B3B29F6
FVNIRASFFYNCKVFNQVHWLRLAMGLALFDHKLAKSAIPPCCSNRERAIIKIRNLKQGNSSQNFVA